MFETFGEFDSCHEINMAAEGLREEKDFDGLRKLAEENGLSDYVDDYIDGQTEELCNVITAAIGKLSVEKTEVAEWAPLADDIVDYLCLARDLGYDLGDDFVAFPKDLEAAHDEALEVRDEERNKKELANAEKDDPGIRKIYRKICKKYTDEINDFLFRPARSNYEIVKEGQTLHHCVGRGIYKEKMMNEISYIIFMRKKESPEEPCYTIEISPEEKILQAYGKYSKGPGSDTDRQIIKQYAMKVRERICQEASCRKTGQTVTGAVQTA